MTTTTTTPIVPPRRSLWILDSWRDLLLFVATPVLIIPLVGAAQVRWTIEEIGLFVVAFGATGHHLPGFLRAYGDPELFQRFKVRFILAPLFLIGVCALFTFYELSGVMLVLYFWAVWHALMQTYGFLRIYDAKVKSFAKTTTRLDFAMCVTWFAAGTFLSPGRLASILDNFYRSGGPALSPSFIAGLQNVSLAAAVIVTFAFIVNHIRLVKGGHQPNPIKVLLMATSFGFWVYSSVLVSNIIVGAAIFEIFHDVQYLSIVWIVNRKRVESGQRINSFLSFLFRRSGLLIGLYVGLVFAYGSASLLTETMIEAETLKRFMIALLLASGGLHFYYDGFIWKVREKATRKTLDLEGGNDDTPPRQGMAPWAVHGAKWAMFVVPVALLGAAELQGAMPEAQRVELIAAAIPQSAAANVNKGLQMANEGNWPQAAAYYEKAIELQPKLATAHLNLGIALMKQRQYDQAATRIEKALRLGPATAPMHQRLGSAYFRLGRLDDAAAQYRAALELDPTHANTHFNLGIAVFRQGDKNQAAAHLKKAVQLDPNHPRAAAALAQIINNK